VENRFRRGCGIDVIIYTTALLLRELMNFETWMHSRHDICFIDFIDPYSF
jgi:hypothetical protein